MTCSRCGHWWTVLPAHVIRARNASEITVMVQCPNCGHIQGRLDPVCDANQSETD